MPKAVIFDFDGVIVDSSKLLATVESRVLCVNGAQVLPEQIQHKYSGFTDKDFFNHFIEEHHLEVHWLELARQKALLLNGSRLEIELVPGVLDLIELLVENGFLLSIGSGGSASYIKAILKKYKLEDRFLAVVTADDVAFGKPAPDTFLKAADMIGVKPSFCTVIEDGAAGMTAAIAAEMRCIGLGAQKGPADKFVQSLTELTLADFE